MTEWAPKKAEPFRVDVAEAVLDDLKARLARSRLPAAEPGPGWRYGTSLAYMQEFLAYWRDGYDWREAEAEINRWPGFKARIGGCDVHFLVAKGSGDNPAPLILTHGWPGSIVEILELIEPLAHPERHGGDAADAFTVVVPSLPGCGFSGPPPSPLTPREIAASWDRLMRDVLGFERYFAGGGDFGAVISSWMALDFPDAVRAIHISFAPMRPYLGEGTVALAPDEIAWLEAVGKRTAGELAYQQIQGTRPQTLAYALTDSPIGLAAWLLEKFRSYTFVGGDAPPPFPLDRLITNAMLYWLGSVGAANWLYIALVEERADFLAQGERIGRPTGALLFPNDILPPPPESWLRRSYDLAHYKVAPSGGHFPGLENPALLVDDLRGFFRSYRA